MGKLVALRMTDGTSGQLDITTGEVFDESGTRINSMTPLGDHDVALSDAAASFCYQNTAQALGHPVTMRDGDRSVLIQMDLAQADVHSDAALPNYAAGYKLAPGLADAVAPVVVVDKASNKYNTWDSANAFKRVLPNGGTSGGHVSEVNPTLSTSSYSTVEYALGAFVPQNVQANADAPLQPLVAAVKRVMNALLLEREIRVATMVKTTGNWDSSVVTSVAAASKWNGGASADPLADLHKIMENSYMPVTGIVMSELVQHWMVRSPAVQKYIYAKNGLDPIPDMAAFSSLLQLPPIYVGKMKYQASGTTMSYVWGNDVVLLHQPPTNPPTDQEEVSSATTFRWNGGTAPDGATTAGWTVRSYFDPKRGGRGGTAIVVVHNDAEVMTSKFVGGLISGAYQ